MQRLGRYNSMLLEDLVRIFLGKDEPGYIYLGFLLQNCGSRPSDVRRWNDLSTYEYMHIQHDKSFLSKAVAVAVPR